MAGFGNVAADYERTALVQRAAAESLLALAEFKGTEDVLDVGCAGGHITAVLRGMTKGRVVGTDISAEMIARAMADYSERGMEFACVDAEDLGFEAEFDLVFCNSTFQWFKRPKVAAQRFCAGLRSGGTVAIQATATHDYCPVYIRAVKKVLSDPVTGPVFSSFCPPWTHFETAKEYAAVFESAGFIDVSAEIRTTESRHTVEQAFGVFSTGAMVGYLDRDNYASVPPDGYDARFKDVVRSSFQEQARDDGMLTLKFFRVFLSAKKPSSPA